MNMKDFFNFGEIFSYFFRKRDPNKLENFNTRMMHRVNLLAIIMFLIGLVVLFYKLFIRK